MNINYDVLNSLSIEYGDSYYLLDSDTFRSNFRELKAAFSAVYPNFNIAYSYKTNYIPALVKIINEEGGYAEVVSDMETEIAVRSGVKPNRIIWNGPIKNQAVVRQLLLQGTTVNIDSYRELVDLLSFIDDNADKKINLGVRCNYDVGDGVISRFGTDIDSEDFVKIIEEISKRNNINLINLQCHFAKRSVEYWPARAEGMVRAVKKVQGITGKLPERIDLGGGLYGHMADSLKKQFTATIPEYADYAKAAAQVIYDAFGEAGPELIIEPGSALAGDCMKYVCKVESVKAVRGKHFATLMGSQKNISMSGVNPPMKLYQKDDKAGISYDNIDFVGYTCIEGDVLYKGYSGQLSVGDYAVFSNCGSYSIVMKPPFIMLNVPILDICSGDCVVIKRTEEFDDVFNTYSF